ncbi:4-hydroxybenzoate 3-monooxygenase [Kwoniella dejecticola CBS 10117]|uniref:4-hydroxybenzoate 3-monooxygenase n=1 Tax=Kwoniella dejecticola CBS 10117 TaxID=1296121 RepID=A0A1A5ZT98_9TREE|nr:4-hydroxybenzoate 3-monooxygenase [Kwoniella dejecticola CBS 10117]OBR81043.1 4-hydroxybenzoate 3-monooxygenase [Kwoniella dejecticola CBS 10117]
MDREGLLHEGVELLFEGQRHPIDFPSLTSGRRVMIYAQTEICKDLIALQLRQGDPLLLDTEVLGIQDISSSKPSVRYRVRGEEHELRCDYVAGCDGFWGISRQAIPADISRVYERVYPFSWLGIMANVAPSSEDLIYARHDRGFALLSMRSPTISRNYIQVANETQAESWSDQAIWDELEARTRTTDGWKVQRGPITSKSVTPMRSFVHEPMQYHRLFLAGDAAHIVPPTGAKGLNLAVGDVVVLAEALKRKHKNGEEDLLATYGERCIKRVWQAERFSYDMTNLLHTHPESTEFSRRIELARLERIVSTQSARSDFALAYTGFPLE